MKATLVIPTYNRAERLRALLECAARQPGDLLARVVVCDDGSSDHTASVVAQLEGRLPVVHAYQRDEGFRAGAARNMGIDRAVGDVVIFTDDDVLFRPDFVEQHLRAHARPGGTRTVALGLRHRVARFDGVVPTAEQVFGAERDDRIGDLAGASIEGHETPWVFVYSCNFSVRRGGPELRFDEAFRGWGMEDTELGYRLHHAGYEIFEAPGARVLHCDEPEPRDPFRREALCMPGSYDTYVRNSVYFLDKYPDDPALARFVRGDLRWYVQDPQGHWVKNGHENDVEAVIAGCRQQHSRPAGRPAPSAMTPDPR